MSTLAPANTTLPTLVDLRSLQLEKLLSGAQELRDRARYAGIVDGIGEKQVIKFESEGLLKALSTAIIAPNDLQIKSDPSAPNIQNFLSSAFNMLDRAKQLKSSLVTLITEVISATSDKTREHIKAQEVLSAMSA